jgi:hypothetical protein
VPGAQMPNTAVQLGMVGQQRPQGPAAVFAAMQGSGIRPGMYGQPGMPGGRPAGAVVPGSAAHLAQQHVASLKPGEAPRIAAPDGYEWVLCASKEGTGQAWYALPRASAAAYNAQVRSVQTSASGSASRGSRCLQDGSCCVYACGARCLEQRMCCSCVLVACSCTAAAELSELRRLFPSCTACNTAPAL